MNKEVFGNQIPHCEPSWYQGFHSPYYHEGHKKFRSVVRNFVEKEIKPNVDTWIKTGYPKSLHKRAYELGIQGIIYPKKYGGTQPQDYDTFYELILLDELARVGGGGVLGQMHINSMALPPILNFGSEYLKNKVLKDVITGEKCCSLAISEPWAGSDVAGIRTRAELRDGYYYVSGEKKWITGGTYADFFTVAVKIVGTQGISLLLLEKEMEGVEIRKMETQMDNSHSTTFITFRNVKVPTKNLIGEVGKGFKYILLNFNHERFVLAAGAARQARLCYEEAIQFALTRKTFGKALVEHQIIRYKLSEMVRQIESLHDNLEKVAYQYSKGVSDALMGGQCALLKVNASKVFEYCAREAAQIFGGSSIVKEGRGKKVERLYREVRSAAIPGGSEEILSDLAIRQAIKVAKNLKSKL